MFEVKLKIHLIRNNMKNEYQSSDFWGTYFVGRYYFSIRTDKFRSEVGLIDVQSELTDSQQRKLQYENLPAIIHEYIHYLHEISTGVGVLGFGMDLTLRSFFSNWIEPDKYKAISNGTVDPKSIDKFVEAYTTKGIIEGSRQDSIDGKFIEVNKIESTIETIYVPSGDDLTAMEYETPIIHFTYRSNLSNKEGKLSFNKFFLYEGIAYELDRIADKKLRSVDNIDDTGTGTEYIVMRRVARFIVPGIETKTFLCIGVMALQNADCGRAFIEMLNLVREEDEMGNDHSVTIDSLKKKISEMLIIQRLNFIEGLEEFCEIFLGRQELYRAAKFLTNNMRHLYDRRIENPCFDVDLVWEDNINELIMAAQVCDYMYIFSDADLYMRDFLGTSIAKEDSHAMKILLVHDHFFTSHQTKPTNWVEANRSHKCPFYTCCSASYRTTHESICAHKPWRIFEVSANSDNQYCLYGQGMMESKGLTG
jgi:hypothetical protein